MRPDFSSPFPALTIALSEHSDDRARILAAVLSGQATSRRDIAQLLKLRSTSVSGYVAELLEMQLLAETLGPRLGRGRPSQVLVANTGSLVTLVFHVISQSLHAVAINLAGQIVAHASATADKECGNGELIEKFRELHATITAQIPRTTRLAGISFSLSGLIDNAAGEWIFSSRWPRMHHLTVRDIFPEVPGPVAICRNMDSELRARMYRQSGSALLLHWGYGIGASFGTSSGHIVTGSDGFGEVGHWRINGKNAQCRCGRDGCLETVAALWAIGPQLLGAHFRIGDDEDKVATLIQALNFTHHPALEQALSQVVISLGNLCRVFFPQKIIVSGPMVANTALWARFNADFRTENAFIDLPPPELVLGRNSRHYELIGAAGPIFQQSLLTLLGSEKL